MNARLDTTSDAVAIVYRAKHNIGVAIDTPSGYFSFLGSLTLLDPLLIFSYSFDSNILSLVLTCSLALALALSPSISCLYYLSLDITHSYLSFNLFFIYISLLHLLDSLSQV